jgi:small subunit ribosomal protein S17
MIGTVVSVKMDKTAVVSVERRKPHPLYRKIVRTTKRYKAHDPRNEAVLGDVVRIEETKPISKDKHWRIAATLTRGNVAEVQPREIGVPEEAILTPTPPPEPVVSEPVAELEASPAAERTPAEDEAPAAMTEDAEEGKDA